MQAADLVGTLPIDFITVEGDALISWNGTRLTLAMPQCYARMGAHILNFMYGHDIGHVLAATDEQLLMRNLGLPVGSEPRLPAEEVRRTETVATAVSLMVDPRNTERTLQISKTLFKVQADDVRAWLGTWTPEKVTARLAERVAFLKENA